MIILLIIVAAIATAALIGPAVTTLSRATATDSASRGPWGVLDWDWRRTRNLDAHERRWQTALIAGNDQDNRWPDFVEEVERLEHNAELSSDPSPPATFDREWIVHRLELLEASQTTTPPTPSTSNNAGDSPT